MISVDELQQCLLDVNEAIGEAQMAADRAQFEREATALDEQMAREARVAVDKLKANSFVDLGELLAREEQTRANMWQHVVLGEGPVNKEYRDVISSVIHTIMAKAMAMEPLASQIVGEYVTLLQRQHSLTTLGQFPGAFPHAAAAGHLPHQAPAPPAPADAAVDLRAAVAAAAKAAGPPRLGGNGSDQDDVESLPSSYNGGGAGGSIGGLAAHAERGALPSFRGDGPRREGFHTSDTGSEFDPATGGFVDKSTAMRRERNKLAAKGYRQRKRMTIEAVEHELEELRRQNVSLSQHNTVLQTENGLLREQIEFLRQALSGNLGAPPGTSSVPGSGSAGALGAR